MAARDAQIQKLKDAEQISKRRKLNLPAAQVGEAELEEIVKIGQAGENARALMNVDGSEATRASGRLLGDYQGGLEMAKMARTPRTAPQRASPSIYLPDFNADDKHSGNRGQCDVGGT